MYTRNYFEGGEGGMPRGYDGIALRGDNTAEIEETSPAAIIEDNVKVSSTKPSGGILGGLFNSLHLSLPSLDRIGYEELLIIGIAAFLFFSADGDKECALILLALLLIN
jgi:hypothetical protein